MGKSSGKVTIKKYANRRLYDTESSSYITLDRLGAMIREGRDFEVIDAKSGDDITHQVLTQIIVEEESRGEGATMLPVNFLRQLIGLYGGQMQGAVPQYLEAAMDMFQKNQAAMRDAVGGAVRRLRRADDVRRSRQAQHGDVRGSRPRVRPGCGGKEAGGSRGRRGKRSRQTARRARSAAGEGRQAGEIGRARSAKGERLAPKNSITSLVLAPRPQHVVDATQRSERR